MKIVWSIFCHIATVPDKGFKKSLLFGDICNPLLSKKILIHYYLTALTARLVFSRFWIFNLWNIQEKPSEEKDCSILPHGQLWGNIKVETNKTPTIVVELTNKSRFRYIKIWIYSISLRNHILEF